MLRETLKLLKFGKLVLAQIVARRRSAWVVQFPKFNALALRVMSANMPFSRCRPVPIQFRQL
jgi:hypothetical protein